MGNFERTVREFKKTLTGGRQKTSSLDIMGKVTRVEDGVAWVRFAGSEVGDTPVRMNMDCKEGDDVQVRSSGGKAWIVGNQSAPPTDDSKAEEVEKKTEKFAERIKSVEQVAGDAEQIANAVNQNVWSDEAGLHIADGKQDAAAERNTIWNSLGMLFRKGLNPILGILTGDNPRVAIYDGQGDGEEHEVASFGKTTVISSEDANTSSSIKIEPSEISIWKNGSKRGVIAGEPFGSLENPIFFGKLYDYSYIEDGMYCAKSAVVISSSKRTGVDSEQRSTISITPDSIKISARDNCYIGQVFSWSGNLKSNLTANADAYVEGNGSITLKGGHVYLVLVYVAMTNSTNGTVNRRIQIFNKTANTSVLTGDKFVASQAWGTVETQTIYEANEDVTLTVRGSASRTTTTVPTAWIRAVCLS